MSYHVRSAFVLLAFFSLLLIVDSSARGQEKGLKELNWSHAFDLACRKADETQFTKATKRWGVEVFKDNNTGLGVYISQTGCIAVAPNFKDLVAPLAVRKAPVGFTGLDLPARSAGKLDWKDAKTHYMEIFRDPNTDNWLYITSIGNIAVTDAKLFPGTSGKTPKWVHSIDLSARKGGMKDWKDAPKFGIEVYKDGNSGNLIYITENGFVAILPEIKDVASESKAPAWLHGLDLQCRRTDEKTFKEGTTRKFGVEVYHDVTTSNLVFISETGSIAVTPAPTGLKAPTANIKEPAWSHGLNIRCREHGEEKFSDKTKGFGAEVFTDPNLGVTIYINEQGTIGAISTK